MQPRGMGAEGEMGDGREKGLQTRLTPGHRGQRRVKQLRLLGMVAPSASTSTYPLVPSGEGKAIERVYSPKRPGRKESRGADN